MNWLIEWQALSARIKGILDAGAFFYKALHHSSEDSRSVKKKILLKDAEKIFENVKDFSDKYQSVLPKISVACLNGFLNQPELTVKDFFQPDRNWESGNVQFALTSLAAFQSEFNYIIADTQFVARRNTERAFVHLQRSIKVDSDIREKWEKEFEITRTAETRCEQLGATHLLVHGVWAFKVDAKGGKTDLVMQEPLSASEIERAAETLVLTEWKIVREEKYLNSKIEEAKKQTELYATGVLAGIELRNYRYLVMISKDILIMPEDREEDAITYRHINIAVSLSDPSESARTKR